jgi:predicted aspartyl protease
VITTPDETSRSARSGWLGSPSAITRRAVRAIRGVAWLASLLFLCAPIGAPPSGASTAAEPIRWPDGTDTCSFENVEGIVLVSAHCSSMAGVDTTGPFVLDTGAGFLALDADLAHRLGLQDTAAAGPIRFASRPLPRLTIGGWSRDQIQQVLIFDADVARRVTDRAVLGLLGQQLVADRIAWIDYSERRLALIPATAPRESSSDIAESRAALTPALGVDAVPIRFRLLGDGKIVVHARVSRAANARALTLIVDTGSTKTVLFADSLATLVPESRRWRAIGGVSASTLFGDSGARMTRVPWMRVADARDPQDAGRGPTAAELEDADVAVLGGEIERVLAADIGEPVHGLLGYSFLRHYRVAIDFPRRVLWLDPRVDDADERAYEYCHVGVQIERRGAEVVVAGVLDGSPAARAGIRVDDVLATVNGAPVTSRDVIETTRALEGPPGSRVELTLRRAGVERQYRLTRKRLL